MHLDLALLCIESKVIISAVMPACTNRAYSYRGLKSIDLVGLPYFVQTC